MSETLNGMAREASVMQYAAEEYRRALDLLASNGTTVADRRAALVIRDDFERRIRSGELDVAAVARYAATVAYHAQHEECSDPDNCQMGGVLCLRCTARVCDGEIVAEREERAALAKARGEQP